MGGGAPLTFICGGNGVGKTTAAAAAAWELASRQRLAWVKATTLGRWVMSGFDSKESAAANRLITAGTALVLDDLGQEQQTGQVSSAIKDAIEHRTDRGLPVLITSNLTPNQLAERPNYGDWLGSRLGAFQQFRVDGPDHRLQ